MKQKLAMGIGCLVGAAAILQQFIPLQLLPRLPSVFGYGEEQGYLVLLQNNTELRPTGGFLGSYGVLTVNHGQFSLQVQDIYVPDGQVTSHIAPPKPIQAAFQLGTFRLRDANWETDFPSAASDIEWFMTQAGVGDFDGTIAINTIVAQKLIDVIGPIKLLDYPEVITADNFWEITQLHSQQDSFPGSKQKTEFMDDLLTATMVKVKNATIINQLKIFLALRKLATEKQIMFSLHDDKVQAVVRKTNWTGAIRTAACPWWDQRCVSDSLLVSEANLGVNKANCCISREMKLNTVVADKNINRRLTITYFNHNLKNSKWGGAYKAWVRVYYLGQETGQWLTVPPLGESSIIFNYDTPIVFDTPRSYLLLVQKQSGIDQFPIRINLIRGNKSVTAERVIKTDTLISL